MQRVKIKFPTIVFSLIVVIVTWSLIEGWLPFARRKWLFLAVGMGIAVFIKNNLYGNKRFLWLLLYFVIILLNLVSGDRYFRDPGTVGFEIFVLGFPAIAASYSLLYANRKDMRFYLLSFFMVLVFTTGASFIIDTFLLPNAIRMMTRYSITLKDTSVVYAYYRLGLSSYTFPHALPVLVPPVVMGIKNKSLSRWIRIFCWISLISLMLLIYLSGIMTALLLSVVGLMMAIVTKYGDMKLNIHRLVFVGVIALPLLSSSFMESILHESKMAVGEDSYYYNKIESFENSVSSNGEGFEQDGDWEERKDLYSKSVGEIFENMFVGTNKRVGGHSSLLDRFALLGIVGFVPFIVFLILQLRFACQQLPRASRIYYNEGMVLGLLMLALKSSFQPETLIVLFLILPISVYYLSYEKK